MPIYEFICQKCKSHFETIVSSAAAGDSVSCSQCGSKNVKKTISASSFRLSSSGSNIPLGSGLGGCSSRNGFS